LGERAITPSIISSFSIFSLNNPHVWKWEYCGWEEDSPIVLGDKLTRSEIDKILSKLDKVKLIEIIKYKAMKENVSLIEKDPSIFKEYIE
jgi:hypothetical protein